MYIRSCALIEQRLLGAIWEYIGAEGLLPVTREFFDWDDPPEDSTMYSAIMLFGNMDAELEAGSKIRLVKNALNYAGIDDEFPGLIRRLEYVFRVRNIMAHASGVVQPESTHQCPGVGEVFFWRSIRASRIQRRSGDTVNLEEAFSTIERCAVELSTVASRLDDLRRASASLAASRDAGLDLDEREGRWRVYCGNCQRELGEETTERLGLEVWRRHKRQNECHGVADGAP